MLYYEIPGSKPLQISHLVLDYNGTIAEDGKLLPGVKEHLSLLQEKLTVHILTADTHATVRSQLSGIQCELHIIGEKSQDQEKADYVKNLGCQNVVAMGNGRNDSLMLKLSALGVAIIQTEGTAGVALLQADIICLSCEDALNLLLKPARIKATLRN